MTTAIQIQLVLEGYFMLEIVLVPTDPGPEAAIWTEDLDISWYTKKHKILYL